MSDRPLLSIIIVSWNVRELLDRCLRTIDQYVTEPYETIVVDNASHDGTVERLRPKYPKIHWIANVDNKGFAAASNQGLRQASGEFLVLLNPDTELLDNPFGILVEYVRSHADVAAVAPELLYPDHRHQESVRSFPTLTDQAMLLLKLRPFFSWLPVYRRYLSDPGASVRQPVSVDQVMGAAMVIPRTALERVGLFDEQYPNWYEEVDWCFRARAEGYRVVYHPGARIIHVGGSSFKQLLTVRKQRWLNAGLARYAKKHWSPRQAAALRVLFPINIALSWVQLLIKPR